MIPRQVSLSINTMGTSSLKEKGMLLSLLPDVNNKIEDKNDCTSKISIFNKCVQIRMKIETVLNQIIWVLVLIKRFKYHNFQCVLHVHVNRWTI